MKIVLTHKIRLKPTRKQEELFRRAVGTARFAYNWALAEWGRQHTEGEKPSEGKLRKQLNAIKREQFPWMMDISKTIPQQAVKNLGRAFDGFFAKRSKYPKFKKRGCHDSARMDDGASKIQLDGKLVWFPRIGWIRLTEALRFNGRPMQLVLSRTAAQWFVAIPVEIEITTPRHESQVSVGIDLGISTAATLSNGEKFDSPKPLKTHLKKLRLLQRRVSRKKPGSKNRSKANAQVAKLHRKIASIRLDGLHRLTTRITRSFSEICIEDLNVQGMVKNRRLARSLSDIGFYEFRRQLEYKAQLTGSILVIADKWYPSSKTCSACKYVVPKLALSLREWQCPYCGIIHDRDINAAINLKNLGRVHARSNACGEESPGFAFSKTKLSSGKQEDNVQNGR